MERRACDRCFSMKSQCDRRQPCGRCMRLGVSCQTHRPEARRGRPRKPTREAQAWTLDVPTTPNDSASSGTTLESSVSSGVNREVGLQQDTLLHAHPMIGVEVEEEDQQTTIDHDIGIPSLRLLDADIDISSMAHWLGHVAVQPTALGIYSILDVTEFEQATALKASLMNGSSCAEHPPLSYALLAIYLQMALEYPPSTDTGQVELLIDSLRIQCLKSIPVLTWKTYDINSGHAKALVLLSHIWCMHQDLAGIADRWNSLARLIYVDITRTVPGMLVEKREAMQSLSAAIELQDATLMLLHNRQIQNAGYSEPDSELYSRDSLSWHSIRPSATLQRSYFGLLGPLSRLLKASLHCTKKTPLKQRDHIRDDLEQYYLCFPEDLLSFNNVMDVHEGEAMIWVHGIYILTYTQRDLLNLLLDNRLASSPEFHSSCEHALLLGEVLPTMLRVDPELRRTSPATIHLILLSSIIICIALWQFCAPIDAASRILPPQPPVLLISSAAGHLQCMERLHQSSSLFDGKLIETVHFILDQVHRKLNESEMASMNEALFILSHYRWCAEGTGIVACTDEVSLSALHFDFGCARNDLFLPPAAVVNDIAGRRAAIESICRADARVCTPDCFDLNIRFLSSLKGRSDGSLNPPVMSVGFRLNHVDNRILRRVVKRCRTAFEATLESRSPLLHLLLPHALKWPAILHGMLCLSTSYLNRSLPDFIHHQETLRALRAESESINDGDRGVDKIIGILSCQFLLSMFALSECNQWWAHHNRAMIDLISTTTLAELHSSELGRFLTATCAMSDISALSIGGSRISQRCWVDWIISPTHHLELANTSLESITGYPPSLTNIIAHVAANADDNCNEDIITRGTSGYTIIELEQMIDNWKPPTMLVDVKPYTEVVLKIAWECIRKAALIFLWRGKGFHSNILEDFPPERKRLRGIYVNEIISNLQAIFEMVQMRQISIGNLTLWSLTVAGCECGRHSGIHRNEDVAALLHSLGHDFSMSYALRVEEVLRTLWARESEMLSYGATPSSTGQQAQRYLSLEQIAREKELEILLV